MKKLLCIFAMLFTMTLNSCVSSLEVSAQDMTYYSEYVYLGTTYPVVYVEHYPYYYYNNCWTLVPTQYYHMIHHHHHHPKVIHTVPPKHWKQHPQHHYGSDYRPYKNNHNYHPQSRPNTRTTSPMSRPSVPQTRSNTNTTPSPITRPNGGFKGNRGGYGSRR